MNCVNRGLTEVANDDDRQCVRFLDLYLNNISYINEALLHIKYQELQMINIWRNPLL